MFIPQLVDAIKSVLAACASRVCFLEALISMFLWKSRLLVASGVGTRFVHSVFPAKAITDNSSSADLIQRHCMTTSIRIAA